MNLSHVKSLLVASDGVQVEISSSLLLHHKDSEDRELTFVKINKSVRQIEKVLLMSMSEEDMAALRKQEPRLLSCTNVLEKLIDIRDSLYEELFETCREDHGPKKANIDIGVNTDAEGLSYKDRRTILKHMPPFFEIECPDFGDGERSMLVTASGQSLAVEATPSNLMFLSRAVVKDIKSQTVKRKHPKISQATSADADSSSAVRTPTKRGLSQIYSGRYAGCYLTTSTTPEGKRERHVIRAETMSLAAVVADQLHSTPTPKRSKSSSSAHHATPHIEPVELFAASMEDESSEAEEVNDNLD